MKERLKISFSGGKTSGYMTKLILDNLSDRFDIQVVFANTGQENEATLQFVHNCDKHFGFNTTWVEGITNHGQRKAASHRVVTFETASRNGEPFEDAIQKYGVPNHTFKMCTRELKTNPMDSYMESIGWADGSYLTAIGIRTDETRRVSKNAGAHRIVYPLVEWFPADKQDVNDFWEDQAFTLELQEHQGNCKWCFQKSDKKLFRIAQESPEFFDFPMRMEEMYGDRGARKEGMDSLRKIFRGYRTTKDILAQAKVIQIVPQAQFNFDQDSGCSESCEIYDMEG